MNVAQDGFRLPVSTGVSRELPHVEEPSPVVALALVPPPLSVAGAPIVQAPGADVVKPAAEKPKKPAARKPRKKPTKGRVRVTKVALRKQEVAINKEADRRLSKLREDLVEELRNNIDDVSGKPDAATVGLRFQTLMHFITIFLPFLILWGATEEAPKKQVRRRKSRKSQGVATSRGGMAVKATRTVGKKRGRKPRTSPSPDEVVTMP